MDSTKLAHTIDKLLQKKEDKRIRSLLVKEDPATIADVLESLPAGAIKTFGLLPPEVQADVALALSESIQKQILPRLSDFTLARFLHFNEENDAADSIQILPMERWKTILEKLRESKRRKIEKLLTYDPETAGGIMDLNFITVDENDSVVEVTKKVHEASKDQQSPTIVVLNKDQKPVGHIPYKNLIAHRPEATATTLKQPLPTIIVSADQEQVLKFLLEERVDIAGVINEPGIIVGIIRVGDLLKVVQAEATEDILSFAGVSPEEDALDPAVSAVRRRYKWLVLNLGTAFLASLVVSQFEESIAQMAILAAFMPIVAGMGGNAGTQTLAVVVRGLALGNLSWENSQRVIVKEITTGFLDGLIIAAIAVPTVFLFTRNFPLALVLGTAMIINLVVAGLFGALIPLTLKLFKIDPAVASSVFVTTATDIFGFLTFLGLATMVLL